MKKKNLVTLEDLSSKEIFDILKFAKKIKKKPFSKLEALKGKSFILLFEKPSNRTRVSFEVGIKQMGGYVLYLGSDKNPIKNRESIKDVAQVLSRYVDGIIARVFSHKDIVDFAKYAEVPVINGLSDYSHPCQALSDMFTIMEKKKKFKNIVLTYIGDGNNVFNSLILACSKIGINMNIAIPIGYKPSVEIIDKAMFFAKKTRAVFKFFDDPKESVKNADFLYTDVWISMGQEQEKEKRLKDFELFQINQQLIRCAEKHPYLMHCLPAHRGEEITDVIDSKNSIIYDQAENRLHVQKAILYKLINK